MAWQNPMCNYGGFVVNTITIFLRPLPYPFSESWNDVLVFEFSMKLWYHGFGIPNECTNRNESRIQCFFLATCFFSSWPMREVVINNTQCNCCSAWSVCRQVYVNDRTSKESCSNAGWEEHTFLATYHLLALLWITTLFFHAILLLWKLLP